jgi:hypothetical protein
MIMLLEGMVGEYQPQAAAHAQMHQQAPAAEIQQQVLAPALDGAQPAADEGAGIGMRKRIAQGRDAKLGADESAPDQIRSDAAAGDFDFRQFGHGIPRATPAANAGSGLAKLLT